MDNAENVDDISEYAEAKCNEPHEDLSPCAPTYNGFVYVCVYRLVRETPDSPSKNSNQGET